MTHHACARLRRARHRRSRGHGNRFGRGLHLRWCAASIYHAVLPSNGPRHGPLYTS
ncbi:hypothetical protein BF49_6510 [Bradyrhizobium sp.]|nr:hypothetical protein BF49_6510 [Bradyrhizobium sp.]